ncbi:MAG: BtpA/SgcQ family protein [bacterium]|nr:BtpA/SgcQ family protein [bacterium]
MKALKPKSLIGVIALEALPGSPLYGGNDEHILTHALQDLEQYKEAGVESVKLENDFDIPYIQPPIPQEAIDLVIKIATEIRDRFDGPIGVQMLEAANLTSLEIAAKANLDWIRVEGFVYGHIGPEGLVKGSAGELLRLRKKLSCEHIKIFADVKKKHSSHAITADLDITDEVRQAELFLVDGIIVTSKFTGIEPIAEDLIKVRKITKLPLIIGSGMTSDNIEDFFDLADYFIVGSDFRKDGKFLAEMEVDRLTKFVTKFKRLQARQ